MFPKPAGKQGNFAALAVLNRVIQQVDEELNELFLAAPDAQGLLILGQESTIFFSRRTAFRFIEAETSFSRPAKSTDSKSEVSVTPTRVASNRPVTISRSRLLSLMICSMPFAKFQI